MKKLYDPYLEYVKLDSYYCQGIKGAKNYEHREKGSFYNGYGGEREFFSSELNLCGKLENDKTYSIDVKEIILKEFDRKRLNEKFVKDLNTKLNSLSYIELDDNGSISEAEISEIFF